MRRRENVGFWGRSDRHIVIVVGHKRRAQVLWKGVQDRDVMVAVCGRGRAERVQRDRGRHADGPEVGQRGSGVDDVEHR
jgi:hypothetical protein